MEPWSQLQLQLSDEDVMNNEDLTPYQREHKAKREAQFSAILDCIRGAGQNGINRKGIHRELKIRELIQNRMIADMHKRGLIRICAWSMAAQGGPLVEFFAIGSRPDAPRVKPPIRQKSKRQKDRRAGKVEFDDERLAASQWRKHERWAKAWKPQRDVAAAWF